MSHSIRVPIVPSAAKQRIEGSHAGRTVAAALFALIALNAHASGLDDLLRQVREGQQAAARMNADREQRFLQNRDEQANLQKQAEAEFAAAKARADNAKARFEAGKKSLGDLKDRINAKTGEDAQVYAAARQAAADFRAATSNSFVTAQFADRIGFLDHVAQSQGVIAAADLEQLWYVLQQDMTETSHSAKFEAEIFNADGAREKAQVTRVGAFSAFTKGRYLSVQADGSMVALPRQPSGKFLSEAEQFEEATQGAEPILIDPTHGTLLATEAERPTLMERVEQGGVVGYVIIVVGIAGAIAAAFQLIYLILVGRRVSNQLEQLQAPADDNPLGRVLSTFSGKLEKVEEDAEVVELRLSEAVLREVPKLERFQSYLRLAVAAGPLLGLVGTVTGMILTFQSITESGAGDPKLMAAGISQAMVTTVLGLGIAIPLLFVNALLSARSRIIVQILDEQSTGMLARRLEAQRA